MNKIRISKIKRFNLCLLVFRYDYYYLNLMYLLPCKNIKKFMYYINIFTILFNSFILLNHKIVCFLITI